MRYTYLKGKPIETLYFGGGTPSQLDEKDFRKVFDTVRRVYGMENCHEITLEANPDDLCPEYLQMLSELPFNRISMGIQTFDDTTLKLLKQPPQCGSSHSCGRVVPCPRFPQHQHRPDLRASR